MVCPQVLKYYTQELLLLRPRIFQRLEHSVVVWIVLLFQKPRLELHISGEARLQCNHAPSDKVPWQTFPWQYEAEQQ